MTMNIIDVFHGIVDSNPDLSIPAAAVKALTEWIRGSEARTMVEFMEGLNIASKTLKEGIRTPVSVIAGCDMFMRFITNTSHNITNLEECRERIINKGERFVQDAPIRRDRAGDFGLKFIKDGTTILIHSYSKVVMHMLMRAAASGRRFNVLVTESRPSTKGKQALEELSAKDIPVQLILDAAVGYYIENVDMVLVGAEGVVENGGLINQIGTYQIAVVAKAAKKPFYAVAERLFPLNQNDLPKAIIDQKSPKQEFMVDFEDNPSVDYTPPAYITLLFTDLGVLTSSGVSDELVRQYC